MKRLLFLLFVFFYSFNSAQNYSVSIVSPSSNSVVNGSVVDRYLSSVLFSLSWTGQKSEPQNIWKFKISYDHPIMIDGETFNPEGWADENNPTASLPLFVCYNNQIKVTMYEQTSN